MESFKRQVRGNITQEGSIKGINLTHINVGCEHAEYLFEQGETARNVVKEGLAIAQGQQRLHHYSQRATLVEVA